MEELELMLKGVGIIHNIKWKRDSFRSELDWGESIHMYKVKGIDFY